MISYEIRIGGTVPPDLLERIQEVAAVEPAGTLVRLSVPDETALWGLIDSLRDAGIDLLEVRRQREDDPKA